ncbi:MAG: hypothetical protein NTY74_13990 [Ignavibacteriae bacterium]|nr:hypothetical protein [Ignavibacteriota bacterium]
MKIYFPHNLSPQEVRSLSKYKKLLSDIIKDDYLFFHNYTEDEDGSFIVGVKKTSSSLLIYWETFSGMYLKFRPRSGMSVGYKFDQEGYIDFFINEDFRDKHPDLMEDNIGQWLLAKKSFPKSTYVTRHKTLKPYIYWSHGEPCLPEHMYLEISLRGVKEPLKLIRKFYGCDANIRKITKFLKTI